MFDSLQKQLPVISALLLCLSVLYDYSYLQGLGIDLGALPTTFSDHARSAIIWLPMLVFPAVLGMLLGANSPRGARTASGNTPEANRVLTMSMISFIPMLVGISLHFPAKFLLFCLPLVSVFLLMRFNPGAAVFEERYGNGSYTQVVTLLGFSAIVLLSGFIHGNTSMLSSTQSVRVVVKSLNGTESELRFSSVRRFASFSLAVGSGKVRIIPAESLVSVQYSVPTGESIGCAVFSLNCEKKSKAI